MIKSKKIFIRILTYVLLLICISVVFYPIIWMLSTSFKPNAEAFATPPSWIPRKFTVENYLYQFKSTVGRLSRFLTFVKNGLIVSLLCAMATIILAIFAGYSFSRYNFFAKSKYILSSFSFSAIILGWLARLECEVNIIKVSKVFIVLFMFPSF